MNVEDVATTLHERTISTKFSPGDLKKTALDVFPKLNKRLKAQIKDLPKPQRRKKVDMYAKVGTCTRTHGRLMVSVRTISSKSIFCIDL